MSAGAVRMLDLDTLVLESGAHESPQKGMCAMEAVAYVAGLPHSDHPECSSAVISAFVRAWNDRLGDADRQKLKPYIVRLVGTRASPVVEDRRAWMAVDWLIHEHLPAWLDLAGLSAEATALRGCSPLVDAPSLESARPALAAARERSAAARDAARDAAWDAAWDAARDAAWDAAWDAAGAAAGVAAWDAVGAAARAAVGAAAGAAARAAAWDAAWDAAGAAAWAAAWAAARAAAWDAAWDAAGAAAWDAAGAAAWDAAWDELRPTVVALQGSAFALLDRMIAAQEVAP